MDKYALSERFHSAYLIRTFRKTLASAGLAAIGTDFLVRSSHSGKKSGEEQSARIARWRHQGCPDQ